MLRNSQIYGGIKMNESEISEKSAVLCIASQEIRIHSKKDLADVVEILQGVKEHRKKIVKYWFETKGAARKAYQEICSKEKEMLRICDETIKNLKKEILCYKTMQERKATKLSAKAEEYRKQEIDKLLNESIEAHEKGDEIEAESKFQQAEMIENLEKYTAKIFHKSNGMSVQKRWDCRITNNELVPAFFNGIEIREVNTQKLLEIRKQQPSVEIPGVEFYQKEIISIRSV